MFEQEQHVCRLAADMVRATLSLADAERAGMDTALVASSAEHSLVLLVEAVYAKECELVMDSIGQGSRRPAVLVAEQRIQALAAEFIASLTRISSRSAEAEDLPLRARMLLGAEFDALSDALSKAGYLRRAPAPLLSWA